MADHNDNDDNNKTALHASNHKTRLADSLIAAYRQDRVEPTRNCGTTSLFSPKQQAIVAWIRHAVTYMDVKTGRPADIRSLSRS